MVKKQEEMNECLKSHQVVEEKGRKNKRKLAEPSQQHFTEFPPYKPQSESPSSWDDPFASYLEDLLSSNLLNLFRTAMNQIIDCGYSEDVVLKAISGSRLYCGGNDLVSNIVNDTLSFLKSGKKVSGLRDYVFEDLNQLVAYTLVEKISLVREVRPMLSTVEAMWRLLMCDLNVLQAFEVDCDALDGPKENVPKASVLDDMKPNEPVKFGNFPNKNANGATPVSCRKARTKKEMAMLRQKSCVEKIRTYSKGGGYKTAKFASVGGFLVEKRGRSPSDLASKKVTAEMMKVPVAAESSVTSNKSEGFVTALPAVNAPVPLASEKKSGSESEEKVIKAAPDYYGGIPYDATLGIYVPRNKRDELIIKLVPRMKDLQNELQVWTDWANQKVKQATSRLLKDQPELKALRKEKEEAEEFRKQKQISEENTMKRRSEAEFTLNNATKQLEKANNTVRRLEMEQAWLKKEREVASVRASESGESCREAKERLQQSLKNAQSWEGQKNLLQEELKSQRDKVAEIQQEVAKAKNRQNQIEATWKQEKAAKEKLAAQAAALKKERGKLEELGKAEEERIKTKAENDVKYYMENIKRLESEISKLKLKSDCLKIAALKQGIDGSNDGNKRGMNHTVTKANPMAAANVWENSNHGTDAKIKRERECVMCLSEEMSVIFLPCAHQVLCSKCNQLHEKEAMEDCPSCRAKIQRRIQARFARG